MFKGFLCVVSALTLFGGGAVFEHKYGDIPFEVFVEQTTRFLFSFEGRTETQFDNSPAPALSSEMDEEATATDETPAPVQPSAEVEEVEASDDTPAPVQPSAEVEEVEASDDSLVVTQPDAVAGEDPAVLFPETTLPSEMFEEAIATDETLTSVQPSTEIEESEGVSDDSPAPALSSETDEGATATDETLTSVPPRTEIEGSEGVSDDSPDPAQLGAVVEEAEGGFGVSLKEIEEKAAGAGKILTPSTPAESGLPLREFEVETADGDRVRVLEVVVEDLTPHLTGEAVVVAEPNLSGEAVVVEEPNLSGEAVVVEEPNLSGEVVVEDPVLHLPGFDGSAEDAASTDLDVLPEHHKPIRVEVTFVDETPKPVLVDDFPFFEDDAEADGPEVIEDPVEEGESDQVVPAENLAQHSDDQNSRNACEKLRTLNHRAYLRERVFNTRTRSWRYQPVIWCRYNARLALKLAESGPSSFEEISLDDGTSVSQDECIRNLAAHDGPSDLSRACTALWKGDQEMATIRVRDLSMLVPGVR